ncbi:hypothetical protein EUTSA_v10003992mg [Eutrema salsugineum]|uniref:Ubiquitin-conjugating enzyme E2C-binding protein n=1 Tax=Eutrema salsugineum TaxID=72664 RepID=V4KS24_EUTSA|nr:uncharacterized protein LOC18012014 [Eutrema salsugineum]ESQ32812.1 hypothetical protein EUTSA_v10003992mg [Eutrema salsugineum]
MELNPKTQRKWRYTWEAQSHSPNLRLVLFDSVTIPKIHCQSLDVSIIPGKSQILVTWIDDEDDEAISRGKGREEVVSLRVPVPRVLLDAESPVNFRALDDHIEVRLVLLLPVDHPLVSDFNLVTDSLGNRDNSAPLVMDYDLKTLTSMGGVHLHCRNCSIRLTKKALFDFSEMPSINWRESADNWFGNCCCSFGSISEKMVAKYTNSYTCSSGLCLLSATTVLLSKDDLVECNLSDTIGIENQLESSLALSCDHGGVESGSRRSEGNGESHENGGESIQGLARGQVDDSMRRCIDKPSMPDCCVHDSPRSSESLQLDQKLTLDKKFLLDGFLEDVFMAKASNVSKNVKWIEFACPECSSPLGAYPSGGGNSVKPIDGGVRLFKCYISTSSAAGESSDVFRKYTLERMFTNQLVECAKEELSFHVLVKDLTTKSSLFQIVILNPNSWSSTGLCSSGDEPGSTLELSRIVKVLFSDCNSSLVKKIDEEVYFMKGQGEELIELLTNASKFLPSSCAYLQGSLVSSMHL